MRKTLFAVIIFLIPVMLCFSIYRKANDKPPLSLQNLTNIVSKFDYDLSHSVELLQEIKELSSTVFYNETVTFENLFQSFTNFFLMIGKAITLPFMIIYDVVDLLISVLVVFMELLGFSKT